MLAGKPVVRASISPRGSSATLARTPVSTADDNTARITAQLTLTLEGLSRTKAVAEATGEFAHFFRRYAMGGRLAVARSWLMNWREPVGCPEVQILWFPRRWTSRSPTGSR
jgi:hypothetical protein